ncbi:hypothetical protein RS022_02740 [Candidatus Phytoplasma rubi]|uniref:Uncharacterized protein n=1 Tax=Candidatus Phytoplasma rubi TaxID=399025 RepID=A0ABY7BR84_9MOLU|nr:hypothetical protein [Candidatus Phytoplasma rubi]WAN63225.1 hypothetical protein RS022_02740 [Candidatus Phytoplasma rubi]
MENQENQINVFNFANYIIKNTSYPVTNMKLQKLIYYVYTKHLVEKENQYL